MALTLSKLSPSPRSRKKGKRLGRGESSGLGKTSGRGNKGLGSRSHGTVNRHFEGGQMPIYRRIPKMGFVSRGQVFGFNQFKTISLSDIEKLDLTEITPESLAQVGIKPRAKERGGIKVLGSGSLSRKVTVKVHAITQSARERIEQLGGKVELIQQG